MRIDAISIFPPYLDALNLSLIGKARESGLLNLTVHDLREFTTDKHRTVDDTPYGGGAGMVMKPEPWAQALEAVLPEAAPHDAAEKPVLIVPSPAGEVFTQQIAKELATRDHLVFACGRYEGIDERVLEWAADSFEVRPMSLGDYVLNGGEVAVLAMVEAIARLIPGVIGNPASLDEESHSDGLLEYPLYTKPSVWRDRPVPEILLSGDHGRIARWRHEQQLERTAQRRPDLIEHTGPRIDNVGIAVEDLEATIAFFTDLGLELLGRDTISGEWADTAVGLDGNHANIALLQTPDGNGRIELFEYLHPEANQTEPTQPNDVGMHRVCLKVDDIDAALAIAARHGYRPLRGVANYEDVFKLTYVRGPSGILVMFAQQLG